MWLDNPKRKRRRKGKAKSRHRRRTRRSNARRRRIVVVRVKNAKRRSRRRQKRRRQNPVRVPGTSRLFKLFQNGLVIAGGMAAPNVVEPMLPMFGASPGAMLFRKALALVGPGIVLEAIRKPLGLSRKTVNLFWAGIGVNGAIQILGMAGYSIPGLSAGNENALPAPLISTREQLGVGGTPMDVPERLRSNYMN